MAPLAQMLRWIIAVTAFMLIAGGYFGYRWSLLMESENKVSTELRQKSAELNAKNNQLTQMYEKMEVVNLHLIDASAAKSTFLANMSHELRTPMNAIIGFSQILEDGFVGELNEKQKEYIDYILTSSMHLLSLINDVLDLAKVESGKMVLELGRFMTGVALRDVATQVMEKCRENNIQLKIIIEPNADFELEADERKELVPFAVEFA